MHSDLNRLVMDYLVIEGYKSAAEEFSGEAGVITPVDFDSIESRMNIREALQRGDVQDAITRVNDLNPEVRAFLATFAPHPLFSHDYTTACTTLSPFGGGDDNANTKTSVFNMIPLSLICFCDLSISGGYADGT